MDNKTKKRYSTPILEVLDFGSEDIITTSGFIGEEDEFSLDDDNYSNKNELPADYSATVN